MKYGKLIMLREMTLLFKSSVIHSGTSLGTKSYQGILEIFSLQFFHLGSSRHDYPVDQSPNVAQSKGQRGFVDDVPVLSLTPYNTLE